ncbi:MAG: hypothetical protein GXO76_13770 [Calditrichaeota bacterium]|nr:hypothetical protein [Calditrichota bacterium]
MSKKISFFLFIIVFAMSVWASVVSAQYVIDRHKGNELYDKWGWLNGNQILIPFSNHGEVGHYPWPHSGEWPKGQNGHTYIDGICMIVQAAANDIHGKRIHPLETNYREDNKVSPTGKIWGWTPLPGYANPNQDSPALSDDPNTWPAFWPDRMGDPTDPGWPGYWNGYFGKGVKNAQLETYYRMDDNTDKKYEFYPDSTDTSRGGLGMQVAVRAFQWSNVLAQNTLFWLYDITNIGTTDYDSVMFVEFIDYGIGGTADGADDIGDYDLELDMAYAWDLNGLGSPGNWGPVGYVGMAFLESPGNSTNGKDDDDDGIIDERRDNDAGSYIYGPVGYYDQTGQIDRSKGIQSRWHWEGDENGNWIPYTDLNHNGKWDSNEPLNDDVGTDGIGPFDEGYTGPDADGTQGNGRPDQGEPDFGITDLNESDQIGLTGWRIFPVHYYIWTQDERDWKSFIQAPPPHSEILKPPNLANYFASGPFPMKPGQTERFSIALLFGQDFDDLARTKQTVQNIYNSNYRFAEPPLKPTLHAVAGDGKVILYWDRKAEKSYDRFLRANDFEGYEIYRSTEPHFLENWTITDTYGNPFYHKPLAKYDVKDGKTGPFPVGYNGIHFDLGSDTGLRHTYIDSTVQNGQTYYYAIVSYDSGYARVDYTKNNPWHRVVNIGIPPSECTASITQQSTGELKFDINTAMVTPEAPSAGYVAPHLKDGQISHTGPATGKIDIFILDPQKVQDNHTYRITFTDTTFQRLTTSYSVTDLTADSLLISHNTEIYPGAESPILPGFVLHLFNDGTVDTMASRTGWKEGSQTNYQFDIGLEEKKGDMFKRLNVKFPADYEIKFHNSIADTSIGYLGFPVLPVPFTIWNLTDSCKVEFAIEDNDRSKSFTIGDAIIIIAPDPARSLYGMDKRPSWKLLNVGPPMEIDTVFDQNGYPTEIDTTYPNGNHPPGEGDVFDLVTKKPFRKDDVFSFTIVGESSRKPTQNDLSKIAVVPDPYVITASWEKPTSSSWGRGERKLYFTHLPQKCTIRIYTVSGYLVDTIRHDSPLTDGSESWDLLSKDGLDIAYGIYIYHVDSPWGKKIGKFAVIK